MLQATIKDTDDQQYKIVACYDDGFDYLQKCAFVVEQWFFECNDIYYMLLQLLGERMQTEEITKEWVYNETKR